MRAIGFFQTVLIEQAAQRNSVIDFLGALFQFTWYLVVAVIVAMIALMLLRFILNYADLNPFSRPVILVRRLTDRFVNPVRRSLMSMGIQANGAPLVVVLLTILVGAFVWMLVSGLLNMIAGCVHSLTSGRAGGIVALLGYVLYGMLALYSLLIMIRIIFSWGRLDFHNRVMRFLMNATDPVLVPLRQMIPPLGMFDISPIVAFLIIWLFQGAIALTLLRGWPLTFFA
ncbi:MAG TPA: YggT family protein [Pyrinomonadaceae bacterium]|nr:YggT family protein [Pyrinomonadaceae bacterium]